MTRKVRVSDVCTINQAAITKNDKYEKIKYLDTGNIKKNDINKYQILDPSKDKIPSRAKRKVKKNTIIYSTVRPNQEHYGYMHNPPNNLIVSTGFATLDVYDPEVDSRFLYYLLTQKHITEYLQKIAENSVSSYPSINPSDIGALKFNIPVKKEQQTKIADILSVLDAKIELNNRINSEIESIAQTLYNYWFVQFDFPDMNERPYKTSGGKMIYNSELKQEIPEGWGAEVLANWIQSDKTGDWGKETFQGNYTLAVNCIRGTDINGLNGMGNVASPSRFILKKNKHKLLSPYDFIIEISGGSPTQSTGRITYITKDVLERFVNPLICSNFCKAISLKNINYFYNFNYLWKCIYDAGVLFGWEGKTSGIKNLLFDSFINKYYVSIPPETLAKRFYSIVEPLQIKKQKLLKENAELDELRDWLHPMLMNGQVEVGK